jgi:hypothetical protein
MDWQLLFTCVSIAVAGGFILWRGQRTWRSLRGGCSGGCGCSKSAPSAKSESTLITPEQITLRQK